jgi:hypothetical protein
VLEEGKGLNLVFVLELVMETVSVMLFESAKGMLFVQDCSMSALGLEKKVEIVTGKLK